MTHVRYLVAGYAATVLALGGYTAWVLARARALARSAAASVPPPAERPPSQA